jgi:hypothetical protein
MNPNANNTSIENNANNENNEIKNNMNREIDKEEHRIFHSEYNNIDITDIIRELAGPNHDFYASVNHHIRVDWIRTHNNERIKDKIIIAEMPNLEIREFEKNDIIKLIS